VSPPAEPFYLIEITGTTPSLAEMRETYLRPETEEVVGQDGLKARRPSCRRASTLDLDALPEANQNDLALQRYTRMDWAVFQSSGHARVTTAEG
jgi:hypothetical protein